jgi:hypothetical protein
MQGFLWERQLIAVRIPSTASHSPANPTQTFSFGHGLGGLALLLIGALGEGFNSYIEPTSVDVSDAVPSASEFERQHP